MTTLEEIEALHAAINVFTNAVNLSAPVNLSEDEIKAVLATLKRAEGILYPNPDDLSEYYYLSGEERCLNQERFPEVYKDLGKELDSFEKKYQIKEEGISPTYGIL